MHKSCTTVHSQHVETTEHLLHAMIEVLHEAGFRVTEQRKIILEAIAHQVGWHVHPKDVFSYVQKKDDSIGLATVYRTLKMLEDMDLLNKVYLMGEQTELTKDHGAHYHLICLKCGSIHDVNDQVLESLNTHVKQQYGFSPTQAKLSIYGLCKACEDSANHMYPNQTVNRQNRNQRRHNRYHRFWTSNCS